MLNLIVLMGRLTACPELKITNSGINYTRFAIALNRDVKPGGEKKTDFIDCVAWQKTAEFICNYFTKGQLIALEGRIQTNIYEKDGQKRKQVDILVNRVHFTGDYKNGGKKDDIIEDLPFGDDGDLPF